MIDASYSIRHHLWATRRLLDHARGLTTAQLELTVPGVAGSIRYCLAHIVGADQRYLSALGAGIDAPFEESEESDVTGVIAAHSASERLWQVLLENPPDLDRMLERPQRHDRLRLLMLPAQAIHHGTDHRTQVGAILLHHGLVLPHLDVWAFGLENGDFQRTG